MFINPIGTYLIQNGLDPKLSILLGCVIALTLNLSASYCTNYSAFFWLYTFSWSTLIGIVYMVPVHNGWLFFPSQQGLVSGLIIGGFGLGALFFDNISTAIINPHNLPSDDPAYDALIKDRFTLMLRSLWWMYVGLAIIGLLTIWRGPKPEPNPVPALENAMNATAESP